jgi:hypothetical protein
VLLLFNLVCHVKFVWNGQGRVGRTYLWTSCICNKIAEGNKGEKVSSIRNKDQLATELAGGVG